MNPVIDALDRLDEVALCLEAVAELLSPEPDLHTVDRDRQAVLLTFLLREHRQARLSLDAALPR
ncbi:MAG: hypothetical protein Q7U98_17140 [Methylicorpusculum sp.]|uniref:hypothetical protein n=1 Tax=Methylicorpusculum sp. TaxID=2713644 RepID=UPI002718334D|nr:hypothetical protein [Methylicorpusculum sp.]MDO8940882.1 hypothetical protein [Methylicorpusculum sp.]MDP2202427.1 hypothetical protein [Methylicorpusculum sp.]